MPQTSYSAGVLKQTGDKISINVSGTSSAVVRVKGTFSGDIRFVGGMNNSDLVGPRMLTQAGIGSLGTNVLSVNGVIDREFRLVTGGLSLSMIAENWSSGVAYIEVFATEDPSMLLISGPVHTSDEQATRTAHSFLCSVAGVVVSAGQDFYATLTNPADSGNNLFVTERLFSAISQGNDVLQYVAYGNPTAVLANTGAVINRYVGSANTSDSIFRYEVATAGSINMGGATGSGEPIPSSGQVRERQLLVIIPPGVSLGFSIGGAGASLQNSARIFFTLQWYEEETYV